MSKPTIITAIASRDCQGNRKNIVEIEIHRDFIVIDTIDVNDPIEQGDRVYIDINALHTALAAAKKTSAINPVTEVLAILNPDTLDH